MTELALAKSLVAEAEQEVATAFDILRKYNSRLKLMAKVGLDCKGTFQSVKKARRRCFMANDNLRAAMNLMNGCDVGSI